MNKKMILSILGCALLVGVILYISSNAISTADSSTEEATTTGDFDQLVASGDAEDLKLVAKGDSKETVSENFKVEPESSKELKDNEEFDYYEHYVLSNGQVYDIYYKDGGLAGATSFVE